MFEHIETSIQADDAIGIISAVHFVKMDNGDLQISISTPSPSGAAVCLIDKAGQASLIKKLVLALMIEEA